MIDPKTFAHNTLHLLQDDPRRYRNFGPYWYLVKQVLKRFHTRDNLSLLGDYVDQTVIDRMPDHDTLESALEAAIETYAVNAKFNLGSAEVADLVGGGVFTLVDEDAGGL